jgi:hypothetical protein
MNLTRYTITAGVAALSLALSASPALAKGGVDAPSGVVTFLSPDAPAPFIGTSGGGSGSGGSNRPNTCRPTGAVDPTTGSIIMVCTQNRA